MGLVIRTVGGGAIVSDTARVAHVTKVSQTLMVKLLVPVPVGVPTILQLVFPPQRLLLKANPAGNVPVGIDQT